MSLEIRKERGECLKTDGSWVFTSVQEDTNFSNDTLIELKILLKCDEKTP